MLTTLHSPSETPGQPFRVSFTVPLPNNNCQPQPRGAWPSLSLASVPTAPHPLSSMIIGASTVHARTPTVPLPPAEVQPIGTAHAGKQFG